jgi:hypothetical protein
MSRNEQTSLPSQDEWAARYNRTLRSLGQADGRDPDAATRGPGKADPPGGASRSEDPAGQHSAEEEKKMRPREAAEEGEDEAIAEAGAPRLEMIASLEITVGRRGARDD